MKYIDAEKLIALIDAKLEDLGMSGSVWVGRSVLQDLKNDIIASLQQEQPEAELEKEIDRFMESGNNEATVDEIAKHFYDFGCRHTAVLYDDIEFEMQRRQEQELQGLDEAAERYVMALQNPDYQDMGYADYVVESAFKAGAEWMAGQFKTLGETEIYLEDDGGEEPYTQEWLDLATTEFAIPEGFKPGDKVVVQIRKK